LSNKIEPAGSETGATRPASLWLALVPVVVLLGSLWWVVGINGGNARPPLILASVVACLIGRGLGFRWIEMERGMVKGIGVALPAILILMVVGILIGLWIAAGVVPLLIVYGLKLLTPEIFLPTCCLICALVSLATGSSWTTAGTVGVALIGVATGLGINLGMAAGAIISGAYFGDKMSPLSETTNLAPAVTGADLFEHIRHMLYSTAPSFVIALVLFTLLGFSGSGAGEVAVGQVEVIISGLDEAFNLNPMLLLPPIMVLAMVLLRVPALPAILAAAGLGGGMAMVFQGASMSEVLTIALSGYTGESGIATVDDLLTNGGLDSMSQTISLIICAMVFGGVMERTGLLAAIGGAILRGARSTGSLIAATAATCFGMNALASDQYLAIVVPGRMFRKTYEDRGLAPKNLSRVLEDVGTMTSPLLVWNTCGAYMGEVLGVTAGQYWMFCFFNLACPLVTILLGITGWTIVAAEKK
jgi:NhaC family Na+:H+ antiporter